MPSEQRQSWWRRAAAVAGLVSLLCFWTAAEAHFHGAAKHGGVRQECQLCAVGGSGPAPVPNAPVVVAQAPAPLLPPVSGASLRVARVCPSSSPRSPPIIL